MVHDPKSPTPGKSKCLMRSLIPPQTGLPLTGGELEGTRQATGKPADLDSIAGFEPTSAIYHEGFPLRGFFIDFLVT